MRKFTILLIAIGMLATKIEFGIDRIEGNIAVVELVDKDTGHTEMVEMPIDIAKLLPTDHGREKRINTKMQNLFE